jgi:predicted MPP superfamily phosphohydrolase
VPDLDRATLRWLHLTDLHVGLNNESQQTAFGSIITAITQFSENKPFDLVLITGDLAYSGLKEEYEILEDRLIKQLRSRPLFANTSIVSVPGNHDVDCTVEFPPVWKELGKPRQDKFFFLEESGRKTRGSRAKAFGEYQSFVHRCGIHSVDPTTKPAELFEFQIQGRKIAIISTVTAFFSDKDVSDRQRTPAPLHPVRTLAQSISADSQLIVLGHHSPEWFIPDTEQHLHSFLVEKNALYLHGHEHKIRAKFGHRGLSSLGFGAAYQASSDAAPTPYYRNSFAICELTDLLHVCAVSWDAEHGQWRPEQNLPGDFIDRSTRLKDGYELSIPATKLIDRSRPYASIGAAIRADVQIEKCLWLADSGPKRWTELLETIGLLRGVEETYALPTQTLPVGHVQFRVKDKDGQFLVRAVSAHGDLLNYEQLQAINTELDKQDYDGCFVVTLGELSSDAKTLAAQLSSRKAISILERSDVIRRSIRNLPPALERAVFSASDATLLSGQLILTTAGVALLLLERTHHSWFKVLAENGEVYPESDDLVLSLRSEQPSLRTLKYFGSTGSSLVDQSPSVPFDRNEYLEKCFKHFDDVKYAPLAALGFRFKKASLTDMYVNASADVGHGSKITPALSRALAEFVESLNLPKALQHQLETQLRSRYGLSASAEVGAARLLYQRYNNVVVLGDPGSGKTCFVQHEILAYCAPPEAHASWYSRHLPIYLSLAEAAKLLDGTTDLLQVCEVVAARRGIRLPRLSIEQALADGQAALFFDGLDEVGLLDKRISILGEIDKLVRRFAQRGNRFVIASRPAAVQPVEIPEGLTYLQLRGLTESEIRVLAERVLNMRVGEVAQGLLAKEESEIVDRLIQDTQNQPGIARIARNPLLLTLLVLIYANTGTLSTRRHLIYTQAIKTLVSVRGRQTREQQISEADLRTRLGALALAIFRRELAEIPRRADVVRILAPKMSTAAVTNAADLASAFLQEVAEATGLLAVHPSGIAISEDLVSFMHYSFLEYYAAAGLLGNADFSTLPELCANPRWRDVITLLFGMLSEQSDVTPVLARVLEAGGADESITLYRTLLAFDCANECDVPPEQAQLVLADALYRVVAAGAGRYSPELRAELAERVGNLLFSSGQKLEAAIVQGLTSADPIVAAAFADLVARFEEDVSISHSIIDAFAAVYSHDNAVVRAAAMFAIEQRPELRGAHDLPVVKKALKGSLLEKHAARKVVAAIPEYRQDTRGELLKLLDDKSSTVASSAAECLLAELARSSGPNAKRTQESVERILQKLSHGADYQPLIAHRHVTLDEEQIRHLMFAGDKQETELAIRYLPLMKDKNQFVYELLMRKLRATKDEQQIAACLESLASSPAAVDLITIADTDLICSQLFSNHRNVRMAAISLLGAMPDDEQVVGALQNHFESLSTTSGSDDELTATARALAKHVRRNHKLRLATLNRLLEELPGTADDGFGDDLEQRNTVALMSVCESIGGVTDEKGAWRLWQLASDYKTPIAIRRQAIELFGRIVEPSERSTLVLLESLRRDDPRLNDAVYGAVEAFIAQCRRKVEYVKKVYASLEPIRQELCNAWKREVARLTQAISSPSLRDIRDALNDVVTLMASYEEFAKRESSERR